MVTLQQYANRLTEWVDRKDIIEAVDQFVVLLADGTSPEEAFAMVSFVYEDTYV